MKITNNTIKRAVRTFLQAFFGSFIAMGSGVIWSEVNIKDAIIGVLFTSIFAGLSAVYMNMEEKNE